MRDELIDDILTPVYAYIESSFHEANLSLVEESIPLSPHRLAVLFLVLAIGTLLDSSIPPYNIKARDFFDLGKACLSLDDILESSEPATLQALCLTGYFLNQGGPWHSPEAPWCIKGLCTSLVYRVSSLNPPNLYALDLVDFQLGLRMCLLPSLSSTLSSSLRSDIRFGEPGLEPGSQNSQPSSDVILGSCLS
ncbi:hypothetical protein PM082_000863 [Marasmius tenuissimus]|nr:hypothetical protein PM082_000863 [Marasmius tenuissimus]